MISLSPLCHAMLRTFRSTALVVLLVAVAGCSSTATDPGTTPGATTNPPEELYGQWNYVVGILWNADNTLASQSYVSGELVLNRDRTWSHARYIGTIGAFGDGSFTVKGDTLILSHTDASGDLEYTFSLGSEPDPAGGTRKILGLVSMKDPGEQWFSYSLREKKQ